MPRHPKKCIRPVLTEPREQDVTSPQCSLISKWHQHKAGHALSTPTDLCAAPSSHIAGGDLFSAPCDMFQLDTKGMRLLNQHDLALQAVFLKTGGGGGGRNGNYLFCLKRMGN